MLKWVRGEYDHSLQVGQLPDEDYHIDVEYHRDVALDAAEVLRSLRTTSDELIYMVDMLKPSSVDGEDYYRIYRGKYRGEHSLVHLFQNLERCSRTQTSAELNTGNCEWVEAFKARAEHYTLRQASVIAVTGTAGRIELGYDESTITPPEDR